MTQTDRVLKAARSIRGTCQADWLASHTPDGGQPITRVAARIQDLEDRGYTFEILHDRGGTRVYRLTSEPSTGVEAGARSSDRHAPPVPAEPSASAGLSADDAGGGCSASDGGGSLADRRGKDEAAPAPSADTLFGVPRRPGDVPHYRDWEADAA
jgi:hypothetical protein